MERFIDSYSENLWFTKQNYVTYIKSILYCNHACYYNNKWWIDKKEKEKYCQVSSNQIHDNWIPFIILEKMISLTVDSRVLTRVTNSEIIVLPKGHISIENPLHKQFEKACICF